MSQLTHSFPFDITLNDIQGLIFHSDRRCSNGNIYYVSSKWYGMYKYIFYLIIDERIHRRFGHDMKLRDILENFNLSNLSNTESKYTLRVGIYQYKHLSTIISDVFTSLISADYSILMNKIELYPEYKIVDGDKIIE